MDIQQYDSEVIKKLSSHIEEIIKLLGEDPHRDGLKKTPIRAAKALLYATGGYKQNPDKILKEAIFDCDGSKIIIVKDIEFYSFCEHHILPFYGKISIGYIPNGHIVGLSKLARIVNVYARRLQVQERLTLEICQQIAKSIDAKGVIVTCNAQHLCMKMRGVEKQESSTSTIDYNGVFADNPDLRNQFFELLKCN